MANSRDVVYFKGADNILSNFYPCEIEYNGMKFQSVEHAYQFEKAMFHGDPELAAAIRFSNDAKTAKDLSKGIWSCPEWSNNKLSLMDNLILAKHKQVPIFRSYLEQTNNNQLIHNVNDDFWGTGASGDGKNNFGRLLMDVRMRMTPRIKICLFGSSYIQRLNKWCYGDFKVPSVVQCYGRGGMKVRAIPSEMMNNMLRIKPDVVFLQIGANDISKSRHLSEIVGDIKSFVETLKASGVNGVYIGELLQRGNFSKSPGVDSEYFNYCRKYINRRLVKLYGRHVVFFSNLKFPKDYDRYLVHLNDRGMTTYFQKLRRLFLSFRK